ncbi:glucosaminidase domain-containing protein [Enterococcus ureasiticus]|uniref:glucosaminidase domain-containing protein n=1 Tax=Enterococcus ureasiticus TaxID=903984 RepID=UPI001A8D7328|nr:glucosaminidase domain-containing protein [Enterococcus ureasiticus]MBO0474884.1 glucosaminidase domain-containing protein [Enterococcus ureasiticus]
MKKKTLSLLLATVLLSSGLPLTTFAEEVQQTPQESSEQAQEVETSTSESITQESSSQPIAPPTESTQERPPIETTESSNETIPSVDPIPSEVVEASPTEVIQEAPPVNEVTIPVETAAIHFEKNTTTEEFVDRIGESARSVGQEKDLFASVMIAQAILESGSGGSDLSQEPYNNLFGIKGDYEGQFVTFGTQEDDGLGNLYQVQAAFRKYPTVKESLEDYSKLLTDGIDGSPLFYQGTWKSHSESYKNATEALTGTYATDIQYGEKLNELIQTYNLTQYDHTKGEIVPGGDFEPYNNVNYDTGNSYAWGNCTQYVYNRITQLGGHVDLNMGNGQDWGYTGVSRGYEVSNTPKAGTAVSFPAGVLGADPAYGHVAFVEHVHEDGSILISEMNAVGLGVVSTRTITAGFGGMLTYVTPK